MAQRTPTHTNLGALKKTPAKTPAPAKKKPVVTDKTEPTFNASPKAPPTSPPANHTNLGATKPGNPKPGSPGWKAFTQRRWIQNHLTTVNTRPGINQTLSDYNTLAAQLGKDDAKDAGAASLAAYNAGLAGSGLRPQDEAARQGNISGLGDELVKQLQSIQVANANGANAGVGLFNQGAQADDLSTAGQIFALKGVATPSVAPDAAKTLATIAANNNNVYGSKEAAAAEQNRLYHQSELQNSLAGRQKLAADRSANYLSALQSEKSADNSKISNLLTYNLYNNQNTSKTTIANNTLSQNAAIAAQKAAAKQIDQQIAQANAETRRLAANGTITKAQAADRNKKTGLLKDVLTHQTAGSPGKTTYKIPYSQPGQPDGTYKVVNGKVVQNTSTKTGVYPATQAQYDAWLAKKKQYPKQSNMDVFGLPGATVIGPVTNTSGAGAAGAKWTPAQTRLYLQKSGLYTGPEINQIIASLSDPKKAKALGVFNYTAPPAP